MKAITELNGLQRVEFVNFVANLIEESIKTCPAELQSSYESLDFDSYSNSLVQEIWTEDIDKCLGQGIDCVSFEILITDENKNEIVELFEQSRDKAYNEFISELVEEINDIDTTQYEDKKLDIELDEEGSIADESESKKYEYVGNDNWGEWFFIGSCEGLVSRLMDGGAYFHNTMIYLGYYYTEAEYEHAVHGLGINRCYYSKK